MQSRALVAELERALHLPCNNITLGPTCILKLVIPTEKTDFSQISDLPTYIVRPSAILRSPGLNIWPVKRELMHLR